MRGVSGFDLYGAFICGWLREATAINHLTTTSVLMVVLLSAKWLIVSSFCKERTSRDTHTKKILGLTLSFGFSASFFSVNIFFFLSDRTQCYCAFGPQFGRHINRQPSNSLDKKRANFVLNTVGNAVSTLLPRFSM